MTEIIADYFRTDWAAMTATDWAGLAILLFITILMIGLYIFVFSKGNRDKLEQYRDFAIKEGEHKQEVGNGRKK